MRTLKSKIIAGFTELLFGAFYIREAMQTDNMLKKKYLLTNGLVTLCHHITRKRLKADKLSAPSRHDQICNTLLGTLLIESSK